jgi:hypothetical protein
MTFSGVGLVVIILCSIVIGMNLLLSLIKGLTGMPIIPNIIID